MQGRDIEVYKEEEKESYESEQISPSPFLHPSYRTASGFQTLAQKGVAQEARTVIARHICTSLAKEYDDLTSRKREGDPGGPLTAQRSDWRSELQLCREKMKKEEINDLCEKS